MQQLTLPFNPDLFRLWSIVDRYIDQNAAGVPDDTAVAGPPPPTASLDDPDPTDATPVNRPSVAAQMSYQLMREILELSEHADGHDLEYIAWRARQLANDLGYLAEHGRPVPRPRPEPERRRTFPLLRRKR